MLMAYERRLSVTSPVKHGGKSFKCSLLPSWISGCKNFILQIYIYKTAFANDVHLGLWSLNFSLSPWRLLLAKQSH